VRLLTNNGGCALPCWWGIQPGITTWDEARAVWASIDHTTNSSSQAGDAVNYDVLFPVNSTGVTDLLIHLQVIAGVVEKIYVLAYDLDAPADTASDASDFAATMRRYNVTEMLERYSVPSNAFLGLRASPAEPGAPWLYAFYLVYDQLGVAVRNGGEGLSRAGDVLRVCPNKDEVNEVRLYLQTPDSETTLRDFMNETQNFEDAVAEGFLREFDGATNLTVGDLAQLFQSGPSDACFESPASIWP
jgi:hypothetical protein